MVVVMMLLAKKKEKEEEGDDSLSGCGALFFARVLVRGL